MGLPAHIVLSPCTGPSAGPGRLWEEPRLVKGLMWLSFVMVETGLTGLVLIMEMAGLGGSGAWADVGRSCQGVAWCPTVPDEAAAVKQNYHGPW